MRFVRWVRARHRQWTLVLAETSANATFIARLSFGQKMANRLFFALWPDHQTRADLHTAAKGVLMKYPPGGRPSAARNLHLTLLFLGNEVSAEHEAAARRAAAAVRHAPFSFSLNIASSFRESSAWWIGSRDAAVELAELRRQLRDRVHGAGVGYDQKRFAPHVTFLGTAPQTLPPTQIKPIEWQVSEFVLVRSLFGAAPAAYEVIDRWPLLAPEAAAEQFQLL